MALVASSFTFALADVLCDICSTPRSPEILQFLSFTPQRAAPSY